MIWILILALVTLWSLWAIATFVVFDRDSSWTDPFDDDKC